jgi:hypothetical protein
MVGKSVQSFWTNEVWSWNDFTRFRFRLSYGSMGINPESVVRKYVPDRCLFVSYSGELCISPVGLS